MYKVSAAFLPGFLPAFLLVFLLVLVSATLVTAHTPIPSEGVTAHIHAYATPRSVEPGDTVSVHVSYTDGSNGSVRIRVFDTINNVYVPGYDQIVPNVGEQAYGDSADWYGANWATTATLIAPGSTGLYHVRIEPSPGVPGKRGGFAPIIVRESTQTKTILMVYPLATDDAYNKGMNDSLGTDVGGYSLYRGKDGTYDDRARSVSFERPFSAYSGQGQGYLGWRPRNDLLPEWMKDEGYSVAYCSIYDFRDPAFRALAEGYALWITWAHNEYWPKEFYDALEQAVFGGVGWIAASGNEGYWRIELNTRNGFTCIRDGEPGQPEVLYSAVDLWANEEGGRVVSYLKGVASSHPLNHGRYLWTYGYRWIVQAPSHPIMAGIGNYFDIDTTKVLSGPLGEPGQYPAYTDETDGIYGSKTDSIVSLRPEDMAPPYGSPSDLTILAYMDSCQGGGPVFPHQFPCFGVISVHKYGNGVVVALPMRDWSWHVYKESHSIITRNAIAYAIANSGEGALSAYATQEPGFSLRVTPNPFYAGVDLSFALEHAGPVELKIVDVQGRLVTTLASSDSEAGDHLYHWAGTNEQGISVPDGVFFARLSVDGVTRSLRFVKLK